MFLLPVRLFFLRLRILRVCALPLQKAARTLSAALTLDILAIPDIEAFPVALPGPTAAADQRLQWLRCC